MRRFIFERRLDLDISLGECARAFAITPGEMSKIERGSAKPSAELIEELSTVLQCLPDDIKEGLPTDEEVAENIGAVIDSLVAMAACRKDAKEKGFGRGHGGAGEIECPIDKGRLRYSVAAVNGHMWGACSNPGCVRWVQ
jgi:transcriptional regulator with XRE-family HTH domain